MFSLLSTHFRLLKTLATCCIVATSVAKLWIWKRLSHMLSRPAIILYQIQLLHAKVLLRYRDSRPRTKARSPRCSACGVVACLQSSQSMRHFP